MHSQDKSEAKKRTAGFGQSKITLELLQNYYKAVKYKAVGYKAVKYKAVKSAKFLDLIFKFK